jgi:hypothetical protein
MKALRVVIVWLVVVSMSAPAFAGGLRESAAKAAEQQAQSQSRRIPKQYLYPGVALFIGGMAVGIYGFLNNSNGSLPEFGEAEATNTNIGAAGLGLAFAGGTILFLGARRGSSPSVTFGPGRATVSKKVSW